MLYSSSVRDLSTSNVHFVDSPRYVSGYHPKERLVHAPTHPLSLREPPERPPDPCPQGIHTFFARRKTCDADTAKLCGRIDTMIFSYPRDPRFITIRRGGTLSDANHHLLALWAAACAEHVLPLFEAVQPLDPRPRRAVEQARAWTRGEITMTQARSAAGYANAAARELSGAARHAAHAAGQAAAVAHVAAHDLGAAAYAIKAARAAAPKGEGEQAGRQECQWQREQLPDEIRELVLDDQRLRNHMCWLVFDC